MRRKAVILFVLLLAFGCFVGAAFLTESSYSSMDKSKASYEVTENKSIIIDGSGQKYHVPYLQVTGIEDKGVEEKVNACLYSVIELFNSGSGDYSALKDIVLSVRLQSDDYLSLLYECPLDQSTTVENGSIRIGLTINMATGERVFLDDLFSQRTKTLYEMISMYGSQSEFSPPITQADAISITEKASQSEYDYMSMILIDDPLACNFMLTYLRTKPTFFMTGTSVCIIRDPYEMDDIYLDFQQ
jgi:hypothetical protein